MWSEKNINIICIVSIIFDEKITLVDIDGKIDAYTSS